METTVIGLNVAQLLKSATGTIRRVEIDERDDDLVRDLGIVSPTKGSLRLMRTSAGLLVTGTLTQQIVEICSRCLEEFVRSQTIQLDDEFLPVVDVNTGNPLPGPEDPDAFTLTSNHLLDLHEAIRQYAILEDPLRPVCSDDCKGICPVCGGNLNVAPCDCLRSAESGQGSLGALLVERMHQAGFNPEEE